MIRRILPMITKYVNFRLSRFHSPAAFPHFITSWAFRDDGAESNRPGLAPQVRSKLRREAPRRCYVLPGSAPAVPPLRGYAAASSTPTRGSRLGLHDPAPQWLSTF